MPQSEPKGGIAGLIDRVLALPVIRTVKSVSDRFGEDGAGFLSGAIAYSFFISMIPLMLLGLSILGYVLQATGVGSREDVVAAVSEHIPGLSELFGRNVQSLITFKTWAGVLAILGIIWAGTGGVNAIRHSLAVIFRVTQKPGLLLQRIIALGLLILLLVALVGSAIAAALLDGSVTLTTLGILVIAASNVGVVFVVYRTLTSQAQVASRFLWQGAAVAGIGITGLAAFGAWYTQKVVARATLIYGTFAGLVGILVVLNLAAVLILAGAEFAAVRRETDRSASAAD